NCIRQFSQPRAITMQLLRVEDVVQDVISLVNSEASAKHAVVCLMMKPGVPRVLGDRVHLSQGLLNLIVNRAATLSDGLFSGSTKQRYAERRVAHRLNREQHEPLPSHTLYRPKVRVPTRLPSKFSFAFEIAGA